MPLAKARSEVLGEGKNKFTRLKSPNISVRNFYNAGKGNSEGKVGTHMSVAKNALYTRGFAAVGISVACMLTAACLAAGATCGQTAYASEMESQSQAASAQSSQNASYLYAVRDSETNLWGFVDAADASDSVPVRVTWKFAGAIAQSRDDVFAEQWDKVLFPRFWMRL